MTYLFSSPSTVDVPRHLTRCTTTRRLTAERQGPRVAPLMIRHASTPGTTERPIDGGVLTLQWTRAPARGHAAALPTRTLARRRSFRVVEEMGSGSKWLGFRLGRRRGASFVPPKRGASVRSPSTAESVPPSSGFFRPRREREIPAQAQVASAWPRPGASAREQRPILGRAVIHSDENRKQFECFSSFSEANLNRIQIVFARI